MTTKEIYEAAEKEYRAELVKQLEVIGEPLLEGEVIDISTGEHEGNELGPWLEIEHKAIPTGEWLDYYYGMVKVEGKAKLLIANHPDHIGTPALEISEDAATFTTHAWTEELDWTDCTPTTYLEALITALNETKGNL